MMGLVVLAQVIRELIAEGEYLLECIEHREHGKVAVAFALRSRAQPYNIQIETTDNKLRGLFRALLDEEPSQARKPALVKLGGQQVPVVEVDSLPADAAKGRKQRKQGGNDANGIKSVEPTHSKTRSRASAQQLALVPQEPRQEPAPAQRPYKRRRTARASGTDQTP
jgi:hypothetical protein